MAIVKTSGGRPVDRSENTIGEIKEALGLQKYTASVNGEPADDDMEVGEFDVINLSVPAKAGR